MTSLQPFSRAVDIKRKTKGRKMKAKISGRFLAAASLVAALGVAHAASEQQLVVSGFLA